MSVEYGSRQTSQSADQQAAILVPLDGSREAERAVPTAEEIACLTHRALLLVRVIPALTPAHVYVSGPGGEPLEAYQELFVAEERLVHEYLEGVAQGPLGRSVAVRAMIGTGDDPSVVLLDTLRHEPIELVVMTTHGRTGLARAALGGVADRIVRYGPAPVLLLRPDATRPAHPFERALVALDGSPRAEFAITECFRLLEGAVHELEVVQVVPAKATEPEVDAAKRYLDALSVRFADEATRLGCSLATKVLSGDAAQALVDLAEAEGCPLVIATHGRSGVARWVLGSVADAVLRAAHVPLLLVRSA